MQGKLITPDIIDRIKVVAGELKSQGRRDVVFVLTQRFGISRFTIQTVLKGTYGNGKKGGRGSS